MAKKSVFEDIRTFESAQEKRLEKARKDAERSVEQARKDITQTIKLAEDKETSIGQQKIKQAESEAKEEAKKIVADYQGKQKLLEKQFAKNHSMAVDSVFEAILK